MVDFCGHHRRRRCVLIILQICGVKFLCVFPSIRRFVETIV